MFHVRRRPADCAPRKRKKKPGALGTTSRDLRQSDSVPLLVELGPDGSTPHLSDTNRTLRLTNDVTEVGSSNGKALQLYGPHILPDHAVISTTDGLTSITPSHVDAHTYVNGQRIHQTTVLSHGSFIQFGHSNTYRFLDPSQEGKPRRPSIADSPSVYDRSPRALSPADTTRENFETTFDLEGNVETVSTASGPRDDSRSLGSSTDNRLAGIDRYPRGQDPILPAVLEFPEEPQEQFLARVVTHLDVSTPTFRLAPAYTLYLCARYRASTHYRPELTPTERAHKLTLLLQHAAALIRRAVQDRSTDSVSQGFWLANASELLHFLKSDRHVSAFSLQAQDTLADAVQLSFRNLVACLTDELGSAMPNLTSDLGDDHPRDIINILSSAMNLLRKCRVNAALTIQLFSQLFHWISARSLSAIVNSPGVCTRSFGQHLFNRLRNLQAWAESQGLELAAECHLAKVVQCAHLLQAPKCTAEELASLSSVCFKLNSLQLRALLTQYKAEPGEQVAPPALFEQAARAAEGVADELSRAEGREVRLHEDPAPPLQLLLPDDGFSCDVVQGVPPGLADFLQPLQTSGLCRLAAQPTSSGYWTVYMNVPRPPSALSTTQPEVQVIRLHKAGGGMGLSIVAAKGAGQERLGIYIKSVVPGGAADRDGRLAAGDQLLTVDGQSLLGITQEKAAEFLVRTSSVVTLEVAKGGAVYHGLATLLQQPSPTPHRATWDIPDRYYRHRGSQDSLYGSTRRIFTPPLAKPRKNVFFNSDDSLYKSEMHKLTIPTIKIECAPEFRLEVTDFSAPTPISITVTEPSPPEIKIETTTVEALSECPLAIPTKEKYNRSDDFRLLEEVEKYLNVGGPARSLGVVQKVVSQSQDLSSSTSSLNSGVHDSTLDITQIDPNTPIKHWKSPDDVRDTSVRMFISGTLNSNCSSVPDIDKRAGDEKFKSFSEDNLNITNKLTEYERLEILKVLYDWSSYGSEAATDGNFSLKIIKEFRNLEHKGEKRNCVKFASEPDLSPKSIPGLAKSNSEETLGSNADDFLHDCSYANCIFNKNFTDAMPGTKKPKGILKHSNEHLPSSIDKTISVREKVPAYFLSKQNGRRHSDITPQPPPQAFNPNLLRCGSLERLTKPEEQTKIRVLTIARKKFPESYIVKRSSTLKNICNCSTDCGDDNASRRSWEKCWKSCSDIKFRSPRPEVKKCCRYAKKSCPVLKRSVAVQRREVQSCDSINKDSVDLNVLLRELNAADLWIDSPRRMSERDLPSRVDSERTIPSSKSVPALHHISGGAGEQQRPPANHDVFNPGYSRTSSNNSINTNSVAGTTTTTAQQNSQTVGMRSRSTHNLHQQQADGGFYQNLSVYRNKMPSPQQLGDRTSGLRNSQNSLQSSVPNSQRPASAYYPQTAPAQSARPPNLHQSIPNLNSQPSVQRLYGEDVRSGSYPTVNPQYYNQNNQQGYPSPNYSSGQGQQPYSGQNHSYGSHGQQYQGYTGQNHSYNNQQQPQNFHSPNYQRPPEEFNTKQHPPSYPTAQHQTDPNASYANSPNYPNGSVRHEEIPNLKQHYNAGLLREDVLRHRPEEMMRYPSTNNVRMHDSQVQVQVQHGRIPEEAVRAGEMRTSKSDDMLKQYTAANQGDMLRYASSGNIRAQESTKVDIPQLRQSEPQQHRHEERKDIRGQAKLAEMGEEVRRRQNRVLSPPQQHHPAGYYQQNQYNQQAPSYQPPPQGYHQQVIHNTQSMQNLNLNQPYGPQYQDNTPTSPSYPKSPPLAPKPARKQDDPPELPPTSTHPLYNASMGEPPKMAFYPSGNVSNKGPARDPWQREEQERQAEVRREQARAWQDQQIRELLSLGHRTSQQEEQLRVLQLEKEFQRRALEESEQDDDDTEGKESPTVTPYAHRPSATGQQTLTPSSLSKQETPASILKPGGPTNSNNLPPQQPPEPEAPPPPERGSSYVVMSIHNKEGTKRVTFNDSSSPMTPPGNLPIEEPVREDPNSFIRQAESMLASPTTPTDSVPGSSNTPGVIGAQEVYRDPRARRLLEQEQQKQKALIPEKLSFKEKMKMFAMETGEAGTPKDKSKISRAQREIDNLGSPPNSNLVH